MSYRKNPLDATELRRLAQERVVQPTSGVAITVWTQEQSQQLFEEMKIHQIELEMQNEHLSDTRAQLERALSHSTDIYDFAPVGSFNLDPSGTITRLNLAGAQMLGSERARLLGKRFELFLPEDEHFAFNALFDQTMASGDAQSSELSLSNMGLMPMHVQVRIAPLADGLGCQVILVDISKRKQIEEELRVNEERWKFALDATGDGVLDWDVPSGTVMYSKRFCQLYGFLEGEYGTRIEDWSARIHPEDKQLVLADTQAYLTGQVSSYSSEHRGQCKDGSWKWVLSRGAVFSRAEDGTALRVIGTHVDITSSKHTEEALLIANRFQQAVFDSLSFHIAVLDRHSNILQTNAAWHDYAVANGFADRCGFVGANYSEVLAGVIGKDPNRAAAANAGIAAVIAGKESHYQIEYSCETPTELHWFIMKVTPVNDVQGRVVVSHQDVTPLKTAELANLKLANFDALTGAHSRGNFLNLAEQELARSVRYKLPLMVLMLDLDHFKLINDQHGHAVGDAVLQGFVRAVSSLLRESDVIGRLGGEEFSVLLPNTTLEGGRALAQRVVEKVRASPVEMEGKNVAYTVSVGASCLTQETSFSSLLKLADIALYQAKSAGRDCVRIGTNPAPSP